MYYLVRWEIDIEADTPEAAAAEALRIQRDPESLATFFEVYADPTSSRHTAVDVKEYG